MIPQNRKTATFFLIFTVTRSTFVPLATALAVWYNISSYTRARFERAWFQGGGVYGDSGRCWSVKEGSRSYATSGWDEYDQWGSGQAKSYYGI